MQAEAGQPLRQILERKELERVLGKGIFYWGIGNAVGPGVRALLKHSADPSVLFSLMRSRPKHSDAAPASVLVWNQYIDFGGDTHDLPEHVLLLSRGETASGAKRRHYALVCGSASPLTSDVSAQLDPSHFRNLSGKGGNIAPSQVTAIIEHTTRHSTSKCYPVNFQATLRAPYFVQLGRPRRMTERERASVEALSRSDAKPSDWKQLVTGIRTVQN